jgi:DNA processing protein
MPSVREDASDWLRLTLVPGVTPAAQRALLKAFGTPASIGIANRSSLAAVVGQSMAHLLAEGPDQSSMDRALAWLADGAHRLVVLGDEVYPQALLETADPPTVLYFAGDVSLLNRPTIAIVGSRNASRQGALDAERFARTLSDAGFAIASGMALGIDASAHRGGLAGASSSLAVVGTGLDRVYPAANRELAHELANRGALLSEFPLGTPPSAGNFPRRNRVISGLSRGVLVVEAALKSGSLTTAKLALEQGREVFAIPGSIHSPLSKGCHWLIKQGAKLVESAEDVLSELCGCPSTLAPLNGDVPETRDNEPLLAMMGHAPASADSLAIGSGLPAAQVAAELTRLELEGRVEKLSGGLFRQLAVPCARPSSPQWSSGPCPKY